MIQSTDPIVERASIAEVFDFEQMARRVDVADALIQAGSLVELGFLQAQGGAALLLQTLEVSGDQLGLTVDQAKLSAVGLNQSGNEQIVAFGMKHVEKQVRPPLVPGEMFDRHERKRDVEARRVDDEVDRRAGVIGEADLAAAQFLDVGLGGNRATFHIQRPAAVDGWVRLEKRVVGVGRHLRRPRLPADSRDRQPSQPQRQPPHGVHSPPRSTARPRKWRGNTR